MKLRKLENIAMVLDAYLYFPFSTITMEDAIELREVVGYLIDKKLSKAKEKSYAESGTAHTV